MATVPDLVRDLSAVLRIEEKTIATYARHIREAGMLSQGGRGVNAAQANALDAARLLIALSIPGLAKESPEAVKDFGGLVLYSIDEHEERPELCLAPFLHLGMRSKLETVLARIINAYGDEKKLDVMENGGPYLPSISVEFSPIMTAATVRLYGHKYYFHHLNFERQVASMDVDIFTASEADLAEYKASSDEFHRLHNRYFCGIRQTIEIAGPELRNVGEMLAGHREPGVIDEVAELLASQFEASRND